MSTKRLTTAGRCHGSHLRQAANESDCQQPASKIYPNCSSEASIDQRKSRIRGHGDPCSHGHCRHAEDGERLEVAPELLFAPEASHVDGILLHTGSLAAIVFNILMLDVLVGEVSGLNALFMLHEVGHDVEGVQRRRYGEVDRYLCGIVPA